MLMTIGPRAFAARSSDADTVPNKTRQKPTSGLRTARHSTPGTKVKSTRLLGNNYRFLAPDRTGKMEPNSLQDSELVTPVRWGTDLANSSKRRGGLTVLPTGINVAPAPPPSASRLYPRAKACRYGVTI